MNYIISRILLTWRSCGLQIISRNSSRPRPIGAQSSSYLCNRTISCASLGLNIKESNKPVLLKTTVMYKWNISTQHSLHRPRHRPILVRFISLSEERLKKRIPQKKSVSKEVRKLQEQFKEKEDEDDEDGSKDETDEILLNEETKLYEELIEEEPYDDAGKKTSYKDIIINVRGLRVDTIISQAGFAGVSRNKAMDLFYDGKIRLNGSIPTKKSVSMSVGDIGDLLVDFDEDDNTRFKVNRVKILKIVNATDTKISILIRKFKNFNVKYDN